MSNINRRDFLMGTLAATACSGLCGCGSGSTQAPTPSVPATPVDAGPIESYDRPGVFATFATSHGFFIIRSGNTLHASSSRCTHRRFHLELEDKQIVCPKHGSIFDNSGSPLKGPATSPLPRFAITLDDRRHVIVHPARSFTPSQWSDPAAWISD